MRKYIDAEALKTALVDKFKSRIGAAYVPSWNDAMNVVNSIPAANVVEVRHGRWIEQPPDFDLCGVAYYQCSECGKEQQTPSNYCQFCGAKMDGVKDNG